MHYSTANICKVVQGFEENYSYALRRIGQWKEENTFDKNTYISLFVILLTNECQITETVKE